MSRATATKGRKSSKHRRRRAAQGLRPSLAALEAAGSYELPFGRWKGYSVAQAAERDVRYLRWAARTWSGHAARMVEAFLAGLDARGGSRDEASTSGGDRPGRSREADKCMHV